MKNAKKILHIEKDDQGRVICPFCGKSYRVLGIHLKKAHNIDVASLKKDWGLSKNYDLTSDEYKELKRETINNNPELVTKNLIEKGSKTRFTKGHPGRSLDQISPQEKEALRLRAEEMRKAKVKNKK